MTLSEVKAAIQTLSHRQAQDLATWLSEYLAEEHLAERWDRQIVADVTSGKLDALIAKAEADIAANRLSSLDEILRHP
jgi:hypothetical protein